MPKVSTDKLSIILVDDEAGYRKNFKTICKNNNINNICEVSTVGLGHEGFEIIDENYSKAIKTLAFIDIILPDINGDVLIEQKKYDDKHIHGILVSAHKDIKELNLIKQKHSWIKEVYCKPLENSIVSEIITRFTSENTSLTKSKQPRFDYSAFDNETASFLKKEATECTVLIKRNIQSALELGERLVKVKKILPHGSFNQWGKQELGLHRNTLNRFVHVWETFGDRQHIIQDNNLSITILYAIAAPSVSEEFRERIIDLASSGEALTVPVVKKLKKTYDRGNTANELGEPSPFSQTLDISSESSNETFDKDITSKSEQKITDNKKSKSSFLIDTANIEAGNKAYADEHKEPEKASIKEKSKQQIVGIIKKPESNNFQNLGRHLIFCGLPTDREFVERCPVNIDLNIIFPEDVSEHSAILSSLKSSTTLSFRSNIPSKDLDMITFNEIIKRSIEIYTEGNDSVLFSRLPYPILLIIANNLDCNCFIAEPNINRFKKIISVWNNFLK